MAIQSPLISRAQTIEPLTQHRAHSPSLRKVLVIICAFNEERSLPNLLGSLRNHDVLIINDGSVDRTPEIATSFGANLLSHERRLGKAASLAQALSYAQENLYDIVVEIDADTIPEKNALNRILRDLESPDIGAVSAKQVPIGVPNVAYHIDELIWAVLTQGKMLQMESRRSCHLGGVLIAFRPELVGSIQGYVNDDEQVGISIERRGFKTAFDGKAVAYFDASSCLGHILERRRRMYYGHMNHYRSTAPSMYFGTSLLALAKAVLEAPKRLTWALPALTLESLARSLAWRDARKQKSSQNYAHWVTTYAKNNALDIRNCTSR